MTDAEDPFKVSQDSKEAILKRLKERKAASAKCEICGTAGWSIGDYLVSPVVLSSNIVDSAYQLSSKLHPSITLICKNCGNTKFLNALQLGVMEIIGKLPKEEPKS